MKTLEEILRGQNPTLEIVSKENEREVTIKGVQVKVASDIGEALLVFKGNITIATIKPQENENVT